MKKKLALLILVSFSLAVVSCAGVKKTEVTVATYESVAIGLRTAYVYMSEREKNGTLTGDALVKAKKDYATGRAKFLEAGDMLKDAVNNPVPMDQQKYIALLDAAAKIAASLSKGGGK